MNRSTKLPGCGGGRSSRLVALPGFLLVLGVVLVVGHGRWVAPAAAALATSSQTTSPQTTSPQTTSPQTTGPDTTNPLPAGGPRIVPLPNSGRNPESPSDRGGWQQYLVMAVSVLGVCAVVAGIVWDSRRRRPLGGRVASSNGPEPGEPGVPGEDRPE